MKKYLILFILSTIVNCQSLEGLKGFYVDINFIPELDKYKYLDSEIRNEVELQLRYNKIKLFDQKIKDSSIISIEIYNHLTEINEKVKLKIYNYFMWIETISLISFHIDEVNTFSIIKYNVPIWHSSIKIRWGNEDELEKFIIQDAVSLIKEFINEYIKQN
jgi:hypothetical protein